MKKPRKKFSMLDYLPWHQAIFARAIAAGEAPIDFLDGGTTYVNQSAPKQAEVWRYGRRNAERRIAEEEQRIAETMRKDIE